MITSVACMTTVRADVSRCRMERGKAQVGGEIMFERLSRRHFMAAASAAGVTLQAASTTQTKPAILGGAKARNVPFDSWPKFDLTEEKALLEVLRSGKWYR